MKPGFTMAEAVEIGKKIKMRQGRIAHMKGQIKDLQDKIYILETEVQDLIQI